MWCEPPAELSLTNDEVHVWRAALDPPADSVRQLAQTLSPDEGERAARFHFERDRRRFIAGRGVLRALLGRYLGLEPERVCFRYGPRGKPRLADVDDAPRFNLAHSHELALYAFALDREIGVDLEHVRPMPDAGQIAARFFSPGENAAWLALPESQRLEAFFNCWTRKEAYLKACGDGLARPLDQFEVSLAPGEAAALLRVPGQEEEAARWWLHALEAADGYIAAMAVEIEMGRVRGDRDREIDRERERGDALAIRLFDYSAYG
ncbi:MAG: 4'-phosphopantetheinyl transferase superfamily protein [Thermoflexales bacterium]|nr:4'-phosphopantetheinyl transferase superfamily protein [Thermoflexales bacterium]